MKWVFVFIGLVLVLIGSVFVTRAPNFGEALWCYWTGHQLIGEVPKAIFCSGPYLLERKFILPFQLFGALFCIAGFWLTKAHLKVRSKRQIILALSALPTSVHDPANGSSERKQAAH